MQSIGNQHKLLTLVGMMNRRNIPALFFILITFSCTVGRNQLSDRMLTDSIVKKHKIKSVTEDRYTHSNAIHLANTTIELYDESGNRTKRVLINYTYHKFVSDYQYDFKKGTIIEEEKYYDWNPYRSKHAGDTIIKKSKEKYILETGLRPDQRESSLKKFKTVFEYDDLGRVAQRTDSIKFGYVISNYSYGENEKVNERKHYLTRNLEPPFLDAIDSLFYNNDELIEKEINFYRVKEVEGESKYDRMTQTEFRYYENGLLKEMRKTNAYLELPDSKPSTSIYKYRYEFY